MAIRRVLVFNAARPAVEANLRLTREMVDFLDQLLEAVNQNLTDIRGLTYMHAQGSQIAQSRPSGISAESAFTATTKTEVTLIVVTNTSGAAAKATIYHDDDGSTFDESTALHWQTDIPAGTTLRIEGDSIGAGFVVAVGGQIGIQTDVANALTFTLYGVPETT